MCRCKHSESPGTLLSIFSDGEDFEELDVEAYSSPPELPDVMKEHQDPLGPGHEGM